MQREMWGTAQDDLHVAFAGSKALFRDWFTPASQAQRGITATQTSLQVNDFRSLQEVPGQIL